MPHAPGLADEAVSPLVRKRAAWAWRLLVLLVAAVAVLWVIAQARSDRRAGGAGADAGGAAVAGRGLAGPAWCAPRRRGALVVAERIAVLGGILTFVVSQFITGLPGLVDQVTQSIDTMRNWLIKGPLHLSKEQIDHAGNSAIEALRNNQAKLTSGALSTAATVTEIVTGALLVLFTLIFFLHGGRNIWQFVTRDLPGHMSASGSRDAGVAGLRLADRLRARDLPRRAGRRRRHRRRVGHHGRAAGPAAGLTGLPRRVHPAGRCRPHRVPGRGRGAAGQGLRLRADHPGADHRGAAAGGATCCSRW